MAKKLYVGVDVSLKTNACHLIDGDDKRIAAFTIKNNLEGFEELSSKIKSLSESEGFEMAGIGVEATNVYDSGLVHFFQENPLDGVETRLYRFNPKQINKFKKSFKRLPKNDPKDAYILSEALRFGNIGEREVASEQNYEALRIVTRARFQIVHDLAAVKTRMLGREFQKVSGLSQERIFSDNFGRARLALTTKYDSAEALANASVDEIVDDIIKASNNRIKNPEDVAKKVKQAAKYSYCPPSKIGAALNESLKMDLELIHFYEGMIKKYDAMIAKMMTAFPNTLESVPGIGKTLAAGIISEIGDIGKFKGEAQLANYAGLTWDIYSSGEYTAEDQPLQRTGNRYLRYYFREAANLVRVYCPEYKQYYRKKFREATRKHHNRALSLTARKLARLVYALLTTDQLYVSPEKVKLTKIPAESED